MRDWLHGTAISLCGPGADTCPDWPRAYELADLALAASSVPVGGAPREKVARAIQEVLAPEEFEGDMLDADVLEGAADAAIAAMRGSE